ncbi:MAG TPA: hypothetical protein VG845_10455 [Dehalococcoidia bacterium]|nr:hypothetical protein [Dehalococcoidia bacterium]
MSSSSEGSDAGLGAIVAGLSIAVFAATQVRLFQTLLESCGAHPQKRPLITHSDGGLPGDADMAAAVAPGLSAVAPLQSQDVAVFEPDDVSAIVSAWQMRELGPRGSLTPRRSQPRRVAPQARLPFKEVPTEPSDSASLPASATPDDEFQAEYLALVEQLCAPGVEEEDESEDLSERPASGGLLGRLFRRPLPAR